MLQWVLEPDLRHLVGAAGRRQRGKRGRPGSPERHDQSSGNGHGLELPSDEGFEGLAGDHLDLDAAGQGLDRDAVEAGIPDREIAAAHAVIDAGDLENHHAASTGEANLGRGGRTALDLGQDLDDFVVPDDVDPGQHGPGGLGLHQARKDETDRDDQERQNGDLKRVWLAVLKRAGGGRTQLDSSNTACTRIAAGR